MSPELHTVSLRASDGDRERVVSALRVNAAEGRLDADELEQRVGAALAATTLDEMAPLTADLPARRAARRVHVARRGFHHHLMRFATVMVMLTAIWALTGFGYFWVAWPALGWGIGLVKHHRRDRHSARQRRVGSSASLNPAVDR